MLVATLTTLGARTTLWFLVAFGLRKKGTTAELKLARLRIYVDELDLYLLTFLQIGIFDLLVALPVDLRDVEETILTREEFYEATIRHDRRDLTLIDFAYFRHSDDTLDQADSRVDSVLIGCTDLDDTHCIDFLDADSGTALFLHTLDDLTTRTDDGTDEFLTDT